MKNFISTLPKNCVKMFNSTDHEKLFRKNLKKQGKTWIYRTKEISYSYNEHGFREKSFNDVDWSESVVVFGCSNIEGVGLAEEDTLVRQLERIIQRPVVNMGIGGTGIDIACWNSIVLHEYYPKPKAIVQMWSGLDRYADFNEKNGLTAFGPMFGRTYQHQLNWQYRSCMYIKTDRALWRDKLAYIEGTFFDYDPKDQTDLNIEHYEVPDNARDLAHPGIESNKLAAERIAENLVKQGI